MRDLTPPLDAPPTPRRDRLDRSALFVGWRYLYRRRRSRSVLLATLAFGAASLILPALFLLKVWPEGSVVQPALAIATVPTLILFSACLTLNLFSVFTTISITGVVCGVSALIVVLSVTSGFQDEFQDKVLGVNAHVLVLRYGVDFDEYRDIVEKVERLPRVVAAAPFVFNEMLVRHDGWTSGVLVKGIVPGRSTRVLDIADRMVEGSLDTLGLAGAPLEAAKEGATPSLVLGRELARKLHVKLGDTLRLISPLATLDPGKWAAEEHTPRSRDFRVGGIFYSGFDEYDRRLIYVALPEAQAFLGNGDVVTGVEMRIDEIFRSSEVVAAAEVALAGAPYRVIDWRELNHNLFTALRMQKIALAIILTLIVVVAAFGIVATLTMLVIDKTREIAILKSLGMRSSGVARVFMVAGMTIGLLGTAAGVGIGLAVCLVVARYGYRLDPHVYLIDRLPVRVDALEIALTAAVTLVICFQATIYPARRAAALPPVDGLRF